jgi:hypothetical protein
MKKILAIGFALLLVFAFTAPAMAKVKVGLVSLVDWYMFSQDEENKSGGKLKTGGYGGSQDDDFDVIEMNLPAINQLQIKWSNEHGVSAYLESGMGWGDDYGTDGLTTRRGSSQDRWSLRDAWGAYEVTPTFQLLAGQRETPFSPLAPSQSLGTTRGHIIGIGFGNFYTGRCPQVRGTFKFDVAKLEIAFSDAGFNSVSPFTAEPNAVSDTDSKLPRIDVAVDLNFGAVKLYPNVFYQKKTFDNVASGSDDEIVSYGLCLGLKAGFGPVTIAGEIQTGDNWGDLFYSSAGIGASVDANGKVSDGENMAYWLDVGFKAGPATINLVYGSHKRENDNASGSSDDTDFTRSMYGVRLTIPLAKTYVLRPEYFVYDYDDGAKVSGVESDQGKQSILGVQFMVLF